MTAPLPDVDIDGLLESGFTPGPWRAQIRTKNPNDNLDDIANVWASTGRDLVAIRELSTMNGNMVARMVADARLIAAAPSLLHLCAAQRDRIAALEARVAELS